MSERSAPRREIDRFLLSLQFFTRVPIPARVSYSEDELNKAVVYFPLIGTLIGAACALVYWGASFLWDAPIAIFLSMSVVAVGMMFFVQQGNWFLALALFVVANFGANGSFGFSKPSSG